jgi:hypothetical protein
MSLALCFGLRAESVQIVVAGLGGQEEYESRFQQLAKDAQKLAEASGTRSIALLGESSTRASMQKALEDNAKSLKPEDTLSLVLIGHGTHDGDEFKFNVRGQDITGQDIANWMDRIAGRQLLVFACSAGGGAVNTVKRADRVVISATRSGQERNAIVFARYWVEAMRDATADADKNDVISALEAFRYADRKTTQFYETQKRLATEHAVLEDTGKLEAARNPGPENGQGLQAGRFAVVRLGPVQNAMRSPEKQKLLEKKEELEQEIDKLKFEKAAMPVAEYKKKLSALLVDLARVQEELDK